MGQAWSEQQCEQAAFGCADGGLGFYKVADTLPAAYVASRAMTHEHCTAIRPDHKWDSQVAGSALACAYGSLSAVVDDPSVLDGERSRMTQKRLGKAIRDRKRRIWKESVSPADRVRFNAYSAKGCGKLYELTPSLTLDTHLTASDYAANVAVTLGVDVLDYGKLCRFCGKLLDAGGVHCMSCMYGGEQVLEHNGVRDLIYDYCQRGNLRPSRETPDLLKNDVDPDCQERPADVLVVPHFVLHRRLPDGNLAVRTERTCFDFAVVNALGQEHWSETVVRGGAAADGYDTVKRRRRDTEERCAAEGLRYWPVVLEHQGGTAKGADAAFRAIAKAVALNERREEHGVRNEILQRIAVVVARAVAQRIRRRAQGFTGNRPPWAAAAAQIGATDFGEWQ